MELADEVVRAPPGSACSSGCFAPQCFNQPDTEAQSAQGSSSGRPDTRGWGIDGVTGGVASFRMPAQARLS